MYIYVCVCVCVYFEESIFRQQVIIQASFVKDDGTMFVIFNFIFSRLLVIFLVSGKHSNRQLLNKILQIIKTVKTQQSTQNYTTPDDNQKYGWKHLGRRYGTIPLRSRSSP